MLQGRFEEAVASAEETFRNGEEFFGIDIERPHYEQTYRHIPRYDTTENTVYLNPLLPNYSEHETRHVLHYGVVQDVVDRNVERVKTYYEEELADLAPIPSGSGVRLASQKLVNLLGFETKTDTFYDTARTQNLDAEDLSQQVIGQNRRTNPVQQEFFAENESDSEIYMNALAAPVSGMVSSVGAIELYHGGSELVKQEPWAILPPFAILATYRALQHLRQSGSAEPLTDKNLERYEQDDRKRGMLYNSRVTNNIDDFLTVLDKYGIE